MMLHPDQLQLAPMTEADIDAVLAVEQAVYPFPWTRGHFADSLASGYDGWTLSTPAGELVGYFLLMHAVDETHLLNVAVAAPFQGQGLGRHLLDVIAARARGHMMESVLLEVRPSNTRALQVYQQYGYQEIGRRKQYYPAGPGQREDAIIMRYTL
ncbi:ribosomal protein S18-alanine N-acetyltransferase [Massilia sp. TS11]|uniref:ribosomal protein S18-alanine N-acetyltransferase n=1 Tax=Massilia sp. TS11 TaxID=2908003 RepID=UPI001EDA4049|nr:ribosomal protein S18-alanine N-acetyltransferase [Massilia sp. TS11]MCG2584254.1 ribosomal protein S18-alanine N-acetyltransferase [Massilia sp. TS11]